MFLTTKRFDPDAEANESSRKKLKVDKSTKKSASSKNVELETTDKPDLDLEDQSQSQRTNYKAKNTYETRGSGNEDDNSSDEQSSDEVSIDPSATELQIDPKHYSLIQKFQSVYKRIQKKASKYEVLSESEDEKDGDKDQKEEDIIKDAEKPADLVPLPQPSQVPQKEAIREVPKWMTEPIFIPTDATCSFQDFHLSETTMKNLTESGFQKAFAVQTKVIEALLTDTRDRLSPDRKSDVLVNSFTGSGKTLAYSVPIIEALSTRVVPRIRALIILPTKPLILQVRQVMETLSKGTNLRTLALRSDRHFVNEQALLTGQTPDILITTPGRLVDHLQNTAGFTLQHLQYLVVDEADRLLNQSFQEWVTTVMKAIPEHPKLPQRPVQKLIFSATLTRDPGKLSSLRISSSPKIFIVGDKPDTVLEFSVPKSLSEKQVVVKSTTSKPLVLLELLLHFNITKDTIVFVKSNETASRLARLLVLVDEETSKQSLSVDKCNGEMDVTTRRKKLKQFEQGEIGVLVCTDLIARGVDIASVQHVINYDLPIGTRDYVHRVGRTARAGKHGTSWSFTCGKGEKMHFQDIVDSIEREATIEQLSEGDVLDKQLRKAKDEGYQRALKRLQEEVYA